MSMAPLSYLSRVLVLICFLNVHVYSQFTTSNLPEITTHPQGGIYNSVTQITLTCEATNSPSIRWTHNNVLLTPNDPRISSSTTLTISSLTAETSGNYVCLATNSVGTVASMEAVLTSAELTSSFFSTDASNPAIVSATAGQPFTMSCGPYTNIPDSAVDWEVYESGAPNLQIDAGIDKAIIGINGSLYFQDVTDDNARTYVCRVNNGILGQLIEGFVQLTVESSGSSTTPQIIVPPRDTTVNDGDTAIFECIAGGRPVPSVLWACPNCGTDPRRVRLSQDGALLRVSGVRSSDVGSYTCTVDGVGEYTVSLTIRAPPVLTTTLPTAITEIIYGNPISLSCTATGDDLTWQWYHNGTRLEQFSESTVEIPNAEEQHSGTYQCYASNPAGFESSVALINVATLPASISSSLPPSHLVFRGEPFEVSCSATGAPPPSFNWFKEEDRLQNDNEFDLSESNVLRIISVEESNSGSYTCMAVNIIGERVIGSDETSTMLTIIEPTVITGQHNMVFAAQENTPVTLRCEVSYDERATLTFSWTKDSAPLVMDDRVFFVDESMSGNVRIDGVVESDAGSYVCTVMTTYQGLIGPPVSTIPTNFTVTATPVAPQILSITSPSPTSLHVVWGFTGITNLVQLYSIEIQLTSNPNSEWKAQTNNVNAITTKTIDGLMPATSYNIRVVALYANDMRVSSDVMSAQTKEGAPSGPPLEVKVSAISNEELEVTWQPPSAPNGVITNYSLQYRLEDEEEFNTVIVEWTRQEYVINNLTPRKRYNIRIATSTSGGMGPYSDTLLAITVKEGGLMEPGSRQPHEQIWFIVLMVIIAVILVTVILVLILVVKYTMYKKKSRKYIVRHRPTSGVEDMNLSEDALQDYLGRSKRSDREGSSVFEAADAYLERESAISSVPYTATPQLSTGSGVRLMGQHAPEYINPPSFEEATKYRSRTHSAASYHSTKDKAIVWDTDDEGTKSTLVGENGMLKSHDIFTNGNTEFDYDSDSIEKPAYSDSMTTEGTEYSHLQGTSGRTLPYNHLNVNPPPESVDLATLV